MKIKSDFDIVCDKIYKLACNIQKYELMVGIEYSIDGTHFFYTKECVAVSPGVGVSWWNDWYEGEPYVKLCGFIPLEDITPYHTEGI